MSDVALLSLSEPRLALWASSWLYFSSQLRGATQKVASAKVTEFSLALRRSAEPGYRSVWRQLRSRRGRCRAWQRKRPSKECLKQAALNTGTGAKRRTQYELKIAALAEKGPNLKYKSQRQEPALRTVVLLRFGSKARPNPFIEGTANGGARLCALPPPVAPLSAPHVER